MPFSKGVVRGDPSFSPAPQAAESSPDDSDRAELEGHSADPDPSPPPSSHLGVLRKVLGVFYRAPFMGI